MPMYNVLVGIIPKPGKVRRQYPAGEPIQAATAEEALVIGRQMVTDRGHEIYKETKLVEEHPGIFKSVNDEDSTYVCELGIYAHMSLPVELWKFLKERGGSELDCGTSTGYCVSHAEKGGKHYTDWENEIATPALEAAGCYKDNNYWVDGERDSFGPLSRNITVCHDGKWYEVFYG